jgi:hypothetical protein
MPACNASAVLINQKASKFCPLVSGNLAADHIEIGNESEINQNIGIIPFIIIIRA